MDMQYLLWLQELREATGGVLDEFFRSISAFAVSVWVYLLMGMVFWCFDKKTGIMMYMNVGVAYLFNQLAKNIFCVYRPWIRDPRIIPAGDAIKTTTGYSFPSGHSHLATAQWGSLAVWQRKRKWVVALCCVMIFLAILARNYLGVHTPQDVLVGMTICILVMVGQYRLMSWVEQGKNRDVVLFAVGLAFCAASLIFMTLKTYPVDYTPDGAILVDPAKAIADAWGSVGSALGFFLGWFIERRFIRFETVKGWWQRLVCLLVGGLALYLVMEYLSPALYEALKATGTTGYRVGKLLNNLITYVFVLAVVPAVIKLVAYLASRRETAMART